jgi:D-sedoheptulose 7-phosphate isomerase
MAGPREEAVHRHFRDSRAALERAAADRDLIAAVVDISDRLVASLRSGGKILIAGNGGSAADAQHMAAEFLSRFMLERTPLPAIALSTDTSVLTAIGNDFGFEHVFARQVRALGRAGDAFIGISTSGRSPNVLAALRTARESGLATIGFTGSGGGDMAPLCDLVLTAPAAETALIQQIHITAAHAICGLVERDLFTPAARG